MSRACACVFDGKECVGILIAESGFHSHPAALVLQLSCGVKIVAIIRPIVVRVLEIVSVAVIHFAVPAMDPPTSGKSTEELQLLL